MTIRTLLKHLHNLAGELGADSEVRMLCSSKSAAIFDVQPTNRIGSSIALLRAKTPRQHSQDEDTRIKNRELSRAWRNRKAKEGRCLRCSGPVEVGRKTDCKACADFRKAKRAAKAT